MSGTLLLGLDGATFTVLDPYMERGVMPFMRSLCAGGTRAPLQTIMPPLTPPAWTSLMTGYGLVWWVLGPMILMPTMMGMGLQFAAAFTGPMLMSLMGHFLYGALTGLGFVWYSQR
jgi:hypothetical protein